MTNIWDPVNVREERDKLKEHRSPQVIIQLEDRDGVKPGPGELCVVPRGVVHNPIAEQEGGSGLIETVTTKRTGDTESPLTRSIEEREGER